MSFQVAILSSDSGPPTLPPPPQDAGDESLLRHYLVGTKAMVLVVDDDEAIREGVSGLLQDAGYEVAEACNGLDGLEKTLKATPMPDLIIVDFLMPVMDGIGMRRALEYSAAKFIPVIVISAVMKDLEADAEFNPERTLFLRKPFHGAVLLDHVSREIEKARKAAQERKANG